MTHFYLVILAAQLAQEAQSVQCEIKAAYSDLNKTPQFLIGIIRITE